MVKHKDGSITIKEDEFVEVMARTVADNDIVNSLGPLTELIVLVTGRIVAEACVNMFGNISDDTINKMISSIEGFDEEESKVKKPRKKKVEKIRYEVIEKIDSFLKGFFEDPVQAFNTRNMVEDKLDTIYSDDDVIIDYCPKYEYIEVFGLNDKEFEYFLKNSDSVFV